MVATSRWLNFAANASTLVSAQSSNILQGTGEQGYVQGASVAPSGITIVPSVSDSMQIKIDGDATWRTITLTPGTNLDPRVVARDINYKIKQLTPVAAVYDSTSVEYVNNYFKIKSGSLGGSSAVAVQAGSPGNCLPLLKMDPTNQTVPGNIGMSYGGYGGQVTASGTFNGQLDDIYTVMIGTQHPVGEAIPSGTNVYSNLLGIVTTAGDWNEATAETYIVSISIAAGNTMNQGTGSVPTMSWTSTGADNSTESVELLFRNYWYNVGVKGLRIKFNSDIPFGATDKFNITCTPIQYAVGSATFSGVGYARYVVSSLREGKITSSVATSTVGSAVGNKGVTIAFSDSGYLTRRQEFKILCSGPQPTTIGATLLNFGSVTVSTYSPTQVVWFELVSGATDLASPRFGLQSHGTAQHHNAGSSDTKFAFGTCGAGLPSIGSNAEWVQNVAGNTDLASDSTTLLHATDDNMPVVTTADQSNLLGVVPGEMITDFIYLAIKLGATETGANPSIVWRCFFDYS